jgi:hypothetical protein
MNNEINPAYDAFQEKWFKKQNKNILHLKDSEQEDIFDRLTELNWKKPWKEPNIIKQLDKLYEKFGENVIKVIEIVSAENCRREWASIASRVKVHTIEKLIKLLWEPSIERGCKYMMKVYEDGIQVICTYCPYYELAKKINGEKWIYSLWCKADPYIVEGFNPEIGFKRTKTLMKGRDCCNHFYYIQE